MHRKHLKRGHALTWVGREGLCPLFSIRSDILRFIYNNHYYFFNYFFLRFKHHNIKREAIVMALPKPSCPSVFLDFLPLSGPGFRIVCSSQVFQ